MALVPRGGQEPACNAARGDTLRVRQTFVTSANNLRFAVAPPHARGSSRNVLFDNLLFLQPTGSLVRRYWCAPAPAAVRARNEAKMRLRRVVALSPEGPAVPREMGKKPNCNTLPCYHQVTPRCRLLVPSRKQLQTVQHRKRNSTLHLSHSARCCTRLQKPPGAIHCRLADANWSPTGCYFGRQGGCRCRPEYSG